ncbi:3'-5' exonuclease family protein [Neisseria montereyensis]|uniref:DNA-directed DNA polymerase n=1 Tax=Neisseria montereyensis TaxID=2973938 RepID=A0ABT2FEW6_9NEIS|nr:3'-5' exonuclease family protein [Neisseria montereyensis]MCS4534698.1 exonuclease domain-containing protein [Neisseria montereyensis]
MAQASCWPRSAAYFARLGMPVAVLDIESTGGHFYQDRITEVALLRFDNGSVASYQWLVNPQQPISSFITGLTGISNEMVADAPVFSDVADELLPLLRGTILVAHNSRFDYTFLRHEFHRAGIDFAAPALCTVQLSRRLYPHFHKHNLDSIIERFSIEVESRHRAMADVVALTDFLEKSLIEKGSEWEKQYHALMNPKMLPAWLPPMLVQQIYALPDTHGVSVWLDGKGKALDIRVHEKAFSEIAAHAQQAKSSLFMCGVDRLVFVSAVGELHAVWLKAQLMTEYGLRPSESRGKYLTVDFVPDEQQRLQARIVPVACGNRKNPPNGLFLHKKSAKKALSVWAQESGLCPSSLDILPGTLAKNEPCPVHVVGKCEGDCATDESVDIQNQRILTEASRLPVVDWGRARRVEIVETDQVSGRSVSMCCEAGALALPDGSWYFDESLPALLKTKFKQGAKAVQVLEAV